MDNVSLADFEKLDIRVGTVTKAEIPEWSHWVMKLTVDLGPSFAEATDGQGRTIFAGLMGFYKPEDLIGKQFPFLVNIEPKKIGPEGDFSQGMMLAAAPSGGQAGEDRPYIFQLQEKVPNGTRVR